MSWASALADPRAIERIYGGKPPELHAVHVHEISLLRDGPQVMIRADLPGYPADPPAKWRAQGFNTVQIEMTLVGVRDVFLQGFNQSPVVDIEISQEGAKEFTIESAELRFHAFADAVLLSKISAYMNGEA